MSDSSATAYPVLPGAEPFSAAGGPHGALVLHGFTGSPHSMRPEAEALAAAGFAVELPLLPGHGTAVADMLTTSWADWSGAAERAYQELAGRCDRVVLVGLSMGGTLACWLASRHSEVAGLVCINPAVEPPAPSFLELLDGMRESGGETMPAIGSDIAQPGVAELAYDATPIAPLKSLMAAVTELEPHLHRIEAPLLLFTSPQDHVVPPTASDLLAARVSGPVERVACERSYHVATLDYDGPDIAARTVDFAQKVAAG
jgi:carboxylesterase